MYFQRHGLVVILCLMLTGCSNIEYAPILAKTGSAALQDTQGAVGYRFGHKTINPNDYFPPVKWYIGLGHTHVDGNKEITKQTITKLAKDQLQPTDNKDYIVAISVHTLELGDYKITSGPITNFIKTKAHERNFKVRDGSLSYIGDFDIETTSEGADITHRLKRTLLEIRCDVKGFAKQVRTEYPNLKNTQVYDYCVHEGRFRLPPANGSIRSHVNVAPSGHTSNGVPTYNTTITTY